MNARQKPSAAEPLLVWERPEPEGRPTPLSREGIVKAALALADAEGLEAVSLRKVGASLGAGAMRLYGYIDTKEELLELMVDAVYGEMAARGPVRGKGREALRELAHRTRDAARKHPWLPDLLGGRPHLGPHALALLESQLAALARSPGFDDIDVALAAVRTVNAYVLGAVRAEASERRAEQESGKSHTEWQSATGPYIARVIATGRFPMLERVVRDAGHPPADEVFDRGLSWVLEGIGARGKR